MKSFSGDASSVGSFISPSAAAQHRFQANGSTVLAVLEKPSNQVNVDFDEFYAERVGNFEHERSIFSHYFRLIEPKRDDTYNLEWENRKLIEETRISKLEFSQLDDKIRHIRKDVEIMKREAMDEQNAQLVRKQQIRRLEELARPVERDITYIVPDRFTQFRDRETKKQGKSNESVKSISTKSHQNGHGASGAAAAILDPTKSLKTGEVLQLEGRLHDETMRVTSLLQDVHTQIRHAIENRHVTTVQYAETHRSDIDHARQQWQENDTVDFQCFYAVAELLKLRFRIMIAQREEIEALETLQRDRDDFKQREDELKSDILEEMDRSRRSVQQELEDSMREFQHQLVALNEQIEDLERKKYELEATNSTISIKEEHLLSELQLWETRYEKLRRRHALDMEGYRCEMDMLEKKLLQLEKIERKRLKQQKQHEQQLQQQQLEQEQLLAGNAYLEELKEEERRRRPQIYDEGWQEMAEQLAQLHFNAENNHHRHLPQNQLHKIKIVKKSPTATSSKVTSPSESPRRAQRNLPTPPASANKAAKKSESPGVYL